MKILLIGGTGIISTSVTELLRHGHDLTCMNRANRQPMPEGVKQLVCDANDEKAVNALMAGQMYDAVLDFVTFNPEQTAMRIRCFGEHCARYVFISTATVYQKPLMQPIISEDRTPACNPYSAYAQNKILCEQAFRASGLPVTIIRPFMTYGDTMIPFILRPRQSPYTLVQRMRQGRPILVPGDGTIFSTVTHAMDFAAGLLGVIMNPATIGETIHITQDECYTWNTVAYMIAEAANAPEPKLVHVASDKLSEATPGLVADLFGDKAQCAIFDNSKLKSFVPGFACKVTLADGLRRTIAYMENNFNHIDQGWDDWCDEMITRFG